MLTEIQLDTFKCFRKLRLPLAPFTLLTGLNASGKSTILQALALLHQSAVDSNWSSRLTLEGSLLALGTLGDVVDKVNGRLQFSVGIVGSQFDCTWTFGGPDADREDIAIPVMSVRLREGPTELISQTNPHTLLPPHSSTARNALHQLIEGLNYISAERLGPRETYPLLDPSRHRTVGHAGDYAPGKLHWFAEYTVAERLHHPLEPRATLPNQTQAWLAEFFPGISIAVERVRRANRITLGIRTAEDTDHHRPQHVGFGITHVFPILVACLHAQEGDLIMIENPEAHLHPLGQAKMGLFLARVAATGVQVLIESHSDHVLNGLRRAMKTNILTPEDAVIHFFQPRNLAAERGQPQIISPQIDREGNIDHWPDGFFDQFEKDMNYFAGLEP
jgi:predicted ATPase